jgi:hypothetical protein
LKKIDPTKTPYPPTIKVFANGNGTDTNHLSINKECAQEVIYFLAINFLGDKEIERTIKSLQNIII